jgi:hypothetical protein
MTDARHHLTAALADQYLVERELGRGASATVYLTQISASVGGWPSRCSMPPWAAGAPGPVG